MNEPVALFVQWLALQPPEKAYKPATNPLDRFIAETRSQWDDVELATRIVAPAPWTYGAARERALLLSDRND
jgi:hypothetical protein